MKMKKVHFSLYKGSVAQTRVRVIGLFAHLLPQVLPRSRNVGHVFVQDVLLGADAVILDVLGPVQLAHVKVKSLQRVKTLVQTRKTGTEGKSFPFPSHH